MSIEQKRPKMSDPFLLAHQVQPFVFNISGGLSPISMRDQMIRGVMVVDRAIQEGLIDATSRSLLVMGAGVGGATAAIHAVAKGVKALLVERSSASFTLQAGCLTRWIDPIQYDWPIQHWNRGCFPWTQPSMPLPWIANRSNHLALIWRRELERVALVNANLAILYDTTVRSITQSGTFAHVRLNRTSGPIAARSEYGAVVLTGIGSERCTLDGYSGLRFWDTDAFEQSNLGFPTGTAPHVLLSGGGDGALQDFLRLVTTCTSAKDVYQQLTRRASTVAWLDIEAAVQSAEDQAQRAYIWANTAAHDHEIHANLQHRHVDIISQLDSDVTIWAAVTCALDTIVRAHVPRMSFVYRCDHFSKCYGLNRFLVLLLLRYLQRAQSGAVTEYPNTEVTSVTGHPASGHRCTNQPATCLGQDHIISVRSASCDGHGSLSSTDRGVYTLVILRHGVTPPSLPYTKAGTVVAQPRQLLPYHVPS